MPRRRIGPRVRLMTVLSPSRGIVLLLAALFLPLVAYNLRYQGSGAAAVAALVPLALLFFAALAARADLRLLDELATGERVRAQVKDRRPGGTLVRYDAGGAPREVWIDEVPADASELEAVIGPTGALLVPAQISPGLRVSDDAVVDETTRLSRGLQLLLVPVGLAVAGALAIALG